VYNYFRTPSSQNIKDSASDISATTKPSQILMKYQRLDIMEVKDLLLSFLHIIKYLPEGRKALEFRKCGIQALLVTMTNSDTQIFILCVLVLVMKE
jgi:glutaredoxin-related protein